MPLNHSESPASNEEERGPRPLGNLHDYEKATSEIRQRKLDLENQQRYQLDDRIGIPWNQDVMCTLTDFYQITMAYAHWKSGTHNKHSVFEVFFRKNPFGGEYTVMAGVNDVLRFVNTFKFDASQINFLKELMPACEPEFFEWLESADCSSINIYAVREGTFVFPREPLMILEGPLAICQLLETTVLNLLNYASLICTNSARYRLAAGMDKKLLEFGLRRAQGPDGGMSASRYSYVGGFDATSNVRAAFSFGIPCKGTHAHAFITSFKSLKDITNESLPKDKRDVSHKSETFLAAVLRYKKRIMTEYGPAALWSPVESELAAFIAYAQAFPESLIALVDTYDVMLSGVPNYIFVALALIERGYNGGGIRLDSGDLAYLSVKAKNLTDDIADLVACPELKTVTIVASNNINEAVLQSLSQQQHHIDTFGIGTHLVTCWSQPALGMVYKLCEVDEKPVMKISQDVTKSTLPYKKDVFRLYDSAGTPILDLIQINGVDSPKVGERVFCQHLTDDSKRCYVRPSRVEKLLRCVWRQGKATAATLYPYSIMPNNSQLDLDFNGEEPVTPTAMKDGRNATFKDEIISSTTSSSEVHYDGKCHLRYLIWCRQKCLSSLKQFRSDHLRFVNPTPYKISASKQYSDLFKTMWDSTAPVMTYE